MTYSTHDQSCLRRPLQSNVIDWYADPWVRDGWFATFARAKVPIQVNTPTNSKAAMFFAVGRNMIVTIILLLKPQAQSQKF